MVIPIPEGQEHDILAVDESDEPYVVEDDDEEAESDAVVGLSFYLYLIFSNNSINFSLLCRSYRR